MTGDGPEAVGQIVPVSRETQAKLARFVDLIRRWNSAENLVSPDDLGQIWARHVADSAQLPLLMPEARRWVDIGSGAGFPGVVIALVGANGTHVDLIESNRRKCAFLRQAIRETAAPAVVHEGRAETLLREWAAAADCVTSRATAPLPRLLELAAPLLLRRTPALFPKGRGHAAEVGEAALAFEFDLLEHESRIDPDGKILEIRSVRPRPSARR